MYDSIFKRISDSCFYLSYVRMAKLNFLLTLVSKINLKMKILDLNKAYSSNLTIFGK